MKWRLKWWLLIYLLPTALPDPGLALRYDGLSATLSWEQPPGVRLTCLSRQPVSGQAVLIRCWPGLDEGAMGMYLGGPGTDAAYRPRAGDVYVLRLDDQETRAALRGETRLPIVWR